MEQPADIARRPNRIPWPPLIYGAALLAGIALQHAAPLGWPVLLPPTVTRGVGAVMVIAGLSLDLWALATLHRARTNILPHRPAERLVTHGPFALSRNPIYVGYTLLTAGLGLVLSNPWLMAAAVIAALATDRLAARREESHLAARFGEAFIAYAARVPRWIGRPRPLTPPPPPVSDRS